MKIIENKCSFNFQLVELSLQFQVELFGANLDVISVPIVQRQFTLMFKTNWIKIQLSSNQIEIKHKQAKSRATVENNIHLPSQTAFHEYIGNHHKSFAWLHARGPKRFVELTF